MDSSDFSILVGRLERESDDDPRIYAIKVALVAALGYALICLVAVAILVACYFVIHSLVSEGRVYGSAILGCVTGIATLVAVARALRVRIDAPEGRRITREEAPALFAAIDDVIQRMATRKNGRITTVTLDAVTLDREFNAGICQWRRTPAFSRGRSRVSGSALARREKFWRRAHRMPYIIRSVRVRMHFVVLAQQVLVCRRGAIMAEEARR